MRAPTLESDTTLITVNRRLARVLRGEYDRAQRAAGAMVWESPDILPYSSWLQRTWTDFIAASDHALPALLGAEQDLSLWEQAIARRPPAAGEPALLQSAEAARNAQQAWALLRAWRLRHDDDPGPASDEVRAFRVWARDYAALCEQGEWVDLASVADRLTDAAGDASRAGALLQGLRQAAGGHRERMLLAGFDELTPQQQALFDAVTALGVRVERQPPPHQEARALRFDFATRDEELEAAARWARQRLEDDPGAVIGIVVPGLAALHHRVAALFADVFTPGAARPGAAQAAPLFNISLGRPLADIPLVGDALLGLRAMHGGLSLADAGRWLLSPYLGGGELGWRARLDAELRRLGEPGYSLTRLGEIAARLPAIRDIDQEIDEEPGEEPGEESAVDAARDAAAGEAFQVFLAALDNHGLPGGETRPVSAWAAEFSAWLARAGWPGERALTSDEYQALQAFHELLGTLAALAPVAPPMDFAAALAQLQRLAAAQLFQPRSGAAPVQILGVLEAAGAEFTHLWLAGLHHQAWPEPARPNPFLPIKLQRALQMPRASSEQQLAWARAWTERMLASAGEVIVSHARQQADESLRPSALIARLPAGDWASAVIHRAAGDAGGMHAAAPALETLDDRVAPAVDTRLAVRGGVSVFKDQAACPFRAFAVHRLGARDVSAPDSSLDPRVRGTLAHRLLELLWQALGGQSRLLALSPAERADLIRASAQRVLASEARRRPHTLRGRLLSLEQQRLESLAEAWLDIEAARAPFEVRAEHSGSHRVAGLDVTLRPDRLDRMDDGQLFLVDYKTGPSNPKDWFGERPDEPQLPVYALAVDAMGEGQVAGLAFAVLRAGELGYRGLGADDGLAPGVTEVGKSKLHGAREAADWQAHKALWRERLTRLARAFLEGDARVDPKVPGATCRYCGLQPLCRVHEQ